MTVNELVEWAAGRIIVDCGYGSEYPCPYTVPVDVCPHEDKDVCQWQLDRAKEILSHPDLALIDSNQTFPVSPYQSEGGEVNTGYVYARQDLRKMGWKLVIPLADALKEME